MYTKRRCRPLPIRRYYTFGDNFHRFPGAQRRANYITQSAFIKSVATLLTGKTIALGIGFLAIPLIARFYTPEDFGIAALFVSIATIGTIISGLGYEQAIVLPKTDTKAVSLLSIAVLTTAFLGLCYFAVNILIVVLAGEQVLRNSLGPWVWAIPLCVLLWMLTKAADAWLLRNKKFKHMAQFEIAQAVVAPGSRLLFGAVAGSTVWGLITGYLLGLATRFALQLATVFSSVRRLLPAAGTRDSLRDTAHEYRDFALYSAPAGLVRALAQEMPVLLLGFIYEPLIVGFYAMANRLVRAPLNVFALSVRRALLQKYSELYNAGHSLRPAFFKSTMVMLALGAVPTVALMLVGAELVILLLGSNWVDAGVYVEILAPLLLSVWIVVPSSVTLMVLRKQHVWLRVQILVVVLQLLVFLVAYHQQFEPVATLAAYIAVIVVTNIGVMIYAASIIGQRKPAEGP